MKNLLKPFNIFQEKIRVGGKNPTEKEYDGNYVLSKEALKYCSAIYTYGVGEDTSAEKDLSELINKPCYLYDHTINGYYLKNHSQR